MRLPTCFTGRLNQLPKRRRDWACHQLRQAEGQGKMTERHLIDPTPELPDETPIENVRFPTHVRNVLATAELKTVGEVRETADETLLSFQNLG
jgi:DNA-directed RNA polymerase alpha subunit